MARAKKRLRRFESNVKDQIESINRFFIHIHGSSGEKITSENIHDSYTHFCMPPHICVVKQCAPGTAKVEATNKKRNERKRLKRLFDKATAMVEQSTKKKTKKR